MVYETIDFVGEVVDRFITVQYYISGGGSTDLEEPVTPLLHDAAQKEADTTSLTANAATALDDAVAPNDVVFISTGFTVPPWNRAEADGPVGAVSLARAIDMGLEATPIILIEEEHVESMEQLLLESDLQLTDPEEAISGYRKVAILSMSVSGADNEQGCIDILDEYEPSAIITIEKPSLTHDGTHRNGVEYDVSDVTAGIDTLINLAQERDIITIGIGDGGNEVGMGRIHDTVAERFSKQFAAVTETDYLIVGSTANWGAYGLEACLAVIKEKPHVMHDKEIEREIQDATSRAQIVDPLTGCTDGWLDGTPPNVSQNVVDQLRTMVELHTTDQWQMEEWNKWSGREDEVNRLLDEQSQRMK